MFAPFPHSLQLGASPPAGTRAHLSSPPVPESACRALRKRRFRQGCWRCPAVIAGRQVGDPVSCCPHDDRGQAVCTASPAWLPPGSASAAAAVSLSRGAEGQQAPFVPPCAADARAQRREPCAGKCCGILAWVAAALPAADSGAQGIPGAVLGSVGGDRCRKLRTAKARGHLLPQACWMRVPQELRVTPQLICRDRPAAGWQCWGLLHWLSPRSQLDWSAPPRRGGAVPSALSVSARLVQSPCGQSLACPHTGSVQSGACGLSSAPSRTSSGTPPRWESLCSATSARLVTSEALLPGASTQARGRRPRLPGGRPV